MSCKLGLFRFVFTWLLIGLFSNYSSADETNSKAADRVPVIYNLDCTEFFVGTFGPIVPETIDQFVDAHAAACVTDLFVNVNAQRCNYRTKVCEAYWDGYDPKAGDDQPFFKGLDPKRRFETALFKAMYKFDKDGGDYPKRMLDRARHNKIKGWISIRMNDGHNPHLPEHPGHNTLFKKHPEWRLPYGMDYERPEVRDYYMKLVQEVCSRYDVDGIELDFVRFWLYFRPGREHHGKRIITAFVEEARRAVRKAAKRLNHPVKLCVRVPSTPWIAKRHGLDAVAWAKAGLVDLIVASPFWPSVDSDVPIETWKGRLIGTNVQVAVGLESGMHSGTNNRVVTHQELRGVIASGLHRGADQVYFFNLFTSPYQRWPRKDHDQLLSDAGSLSKLRKAPRRHPISITRPWSEGEPGSDKLLPFTGKRGVFRIHSGPKPLPKQTAQIELVAQSKEELKVRINGIDCKFAGMVEPKHIVISGWQGELPKRHAYRIPADAISDGYNLVEVSATQAATITWLEIAIQ